MKKKSSRDRYPGVDCGFCRRGFSFSRGTKRPMWPPPCLPQPRPFRTPHQDDFARALELARQAITQDPQRESAFVIWQQAAVAQAGNTYLEPLPPGRYRIDTLHFLANQVNGMHCFILMSMNRMSMPPGTSKAR